MNIIKIDNGVFMNIKNKLNISINDNLKNKIDYINKIIKNNLGFTYYDKNKNKNRKYNSNRNNSYQSNTNKSYRWNNTKKK